MRLHSPLGLAALAALAGRSSLVGAAFARSARVPTPSASGRARSGRRRPLPLGHLDVSSARRTSARTPTSFSYRRSTDRAVPRSGRSMHWTRRAYDGPAPRARPRSSRGSRVTLPRRAGAPRARSPTRVAYSRRLTLSLRADLPRARSPRTLRERHARRARTHALRSGRRGARRRPSPSPATRRADACVAARLARRTRSPASTTTRAPGTRTPATATTAACRWTSGFQRRYGADYRAPLGHRRPLARLGADRGGRAGLPLRARLLALAEHGPGLRLALAPQQRRTTAPQAAGSAADDGPMVQATLRRAEPAARLLRRRLAASAPRRSSSPTAGWRRCSTTCSRSRASTRCSSGSRTRSPSWCRTRRCTIYEADEERAQLVPVLARTRVRGRDHAEPAALRRGPHRLGRRAPPARLDEPRAPRPAREHRRRARRTSPRR